MFVPVNEPVVNEDDINAVVNTMRDGWISSEGPVVSEFESAFAEYCNRDYGISCTNGTHALVMALQALNLRKGSTVLCPALTIMSCAIAILEAGCIPSFVDVDKTTYNIDIDSLRDSIDEDTSALIVVHTYCHPCEMDEILELCNKRGIKIIEDAAEMHGQQYRGQMCGSFGDVSTFSFYPNKQITTGEGGMVLTDDAVIRDRLVKLRNLGFDNSRRFYHEEIGSNYRMTSLQASLGNSQLKRVSEIVARKRAIGNYYHANISLPDFVVKPPESTGYSENIYWVYPLVINHDDIDVRDVMSALGQNGVGSRPFFYSLAHQPVFKGRGFKNKTGCENALELSLKGFYIPSGLALTRKQQDFVIRILGDVIKNIIP